MKCKIIIICDLLSLFLHYDDFMDKVVSLEPNFRLVFSFQLTGRQWATSSIGWHKLDKSKGVLLKFGTSKSNNKENVYFPATYSNLKNSGISSGR